MKEVLKLTTLEMCSVRTNGEQASPAQGFQLIGCHFSIIDKHVNA